jgi:hypothetical protein
VKAGDPLAVITAPELDHQIAQAEANLAQAEATHRQTKANRELGQVTWGRDSALVRQGWVAQQQGDTDRLNYAAQQQAVRAESAAIQSQEAELLVLRQQKAYQQVIAPFDGVVTRRNIDIAFFDITTGTRVYICGFERAGGSGQCHDHCGRTGTHRFDADGRDEIAMLLCGGRDLEVKRVVSPNPNRQTAEKQQQRA